MNLLMIFAGGTLGGMLRLLISWMLADAITHTPYITLCINLTGSFALGMFLGLTNGVRVPPWMHNGITVGLIGGYTTFSTFAWETVKLLYGHPASALFYALLSTFGGWVSIQLGDFMARPAWIFARDHVTHKVRS